MRILSFIIAALLVVAGGGCIITWLSSSPSLRLDEGSMLLAAFGILPFVGGVLLLRYAWRDRRTGGKNEQ